LRAQVITLCSLAGEDHRDDCGGSADVAGGGFQVDLDVVQRAIALLRGLVSEAQSNDAVNTGMLGAPPGGAPETEQFHNVVSQSLQGFQGSHHGLTDVVQAHTNNLTVVYNNYQATETKNHNKVRHITKGPGVAE
jgi:hypothetical protein